MKRVTKTLAVLGTLTATGLAGAAALALAYAPEASDVRARLRSAYDDLKARLVGAKETKELETPAPTPNEESVAAAAETALHAEHALEHGADGRARAAAQSHKPHLAPQHVSTSPMHPSRARRHA